jgi:hypothetical protein
MNMKKYEDVGRISSMKSLLIALLDHYLQPSSVEQTSLSRNEVQVEKGGVMSNRYVKLLQINLVEQDYISSLRVL